MIKDVIMRENQAGRRIKEFVGERINIGPWY